MCSWHLCYHSRLHSYSSSYRIHHSWRAKPSLVHSRHLIHQQMDQEDMTGVRRGRGTYDEGPSRMECSSPRRIIARLFRRMTVRKQVSTRVTPPPRRVRETTIDTVVPGNNNKGNVVNLGVACGLFYLTMASKTELEKMKELQRDTQVLLGEIQEELRRKNRAPLEPSEAVESPTSCLTDAGAMFNCRRLMTPFVLTEEGTVGGDRSGGSGKSMQEGIQEREKLEVELEAELERLQLHLDSESPSNQGHQHAAKTRTTDSAHTSVRDDAGHSDLQGGVAPVELERKLHELLKSRHEERIKELEAAMAYYKRKLCEKEREIYWWRNTAMLLSHRAKESPSKVMRLEGRIVENLPH